jgi:hypothetical protein
LKSNHIEYIQTFSLGSSKTKTSIKKRISFHQSVDIVKLNLPKRINENHIEILLFALKTNGEIYLLHFDLNEFVER